MNKVIKDLWSGSLTAEEGTDSLRITIASKSTGNATASVDFQKDDIKEFASDLLYLAYGTRNILPSRHQPGDGVNFCLPDKPPMYGRVLSVKFYQEKVRYDLEVTLSDNGSTRVYNIDSCFVEPHTH